MSDNGVGPACSVLGSSARRSTARLSSPCGPRSARANWTLCSRSARLLESNPVLMRLRELETLGKIAGNSKLNVVLGERSLAERIVNLL
ncbi:MAG: hypothetical protein ACE15E_02385 [Acidobacteriota bacterium]